MRQTTMAKEATIERKWYVVDADGMTLGRLASEVASVLRGKHKPTFTPHVDTGDYVIVINADKVVMTGKKLDTVKYYHHSGWLGGLKVKTARQFKESNPTGFHRNMRSYQRTAGRKERHHQTVYGIGQNRLFFSSCHQDRPKTPSA